MTYDDIVEGVIMMNFLMVNGDDIQTHCILEKSVWIPSFSMKKRESMPTDELGGMNHAYLDILMYSNT